MIGKNVVALVQLTVCVLLGVPAPPVHAQECDPQWVPTFGGQPGVDGGEVRAIARFEGNSVDHPLVYVGGTFTSAGGMLANYVAKWDGSNWSNLDGGMNGPVYALCVFDDGAPSGPVLYAGGSFTLAGGVAANRIAKWDGLTWSPVRGGMSGGTSSAVYALTVFDDGSGPALFAGGVFTSASGVAASCIAKWNGAAWTSLNGGMSLGVPTSVNVLKTFDDGTGPALYAGGNFTSAGGVSAHNIARWSGVSWSSLGVGTTAGSSSVVASLAVFDDGSGPALFAGGAFQSVFNSSGGFTANNIAKWNGSQWSPLGVGTNGSVNALIEYNDGSGASPFLCAGGSFTSAGGISATRIAKWNGSTWSVVTSGVQAVYVLDVIEAPPEENDMLYVGGRFSFPGLLAKGIARWDGSSWHILGKGIGDTVASLAVFDDGSGPALYAGGEFASVGELTVNHIAKWDGNRWSALGSGVLGANTFPYTVNAIAVYDDGLGGGPALYVGGRFVTAGGNPANHIAKWDGSKWSALGDGVGGGISVIVNALAVFDDQTGGGPALFVGGLFLNAGGMPVNHIAKWNGVRWSSLAGGVAAGVNSTSVQAMAVFDDGTGNGPALYAGGNFTVAGGVSASRIAKWNGTEWSPLTVGVIGGAPPSVYALAIHDDGTVGGAALYVGGLFTSAGGVAASRIARWNGINWSSVGSGMTGDIGLQAVVRSLAIFDEGSRGSPGLYAGGQFLQANGIPVNHLAKWNGTAWSALDVGVTGDQYVNVRALTVYCPADSAPALFAGGVFPVSPARDSYLAQWQGCLEPQPIPGDTNGDGVVNIVDLLAVIAAWGPCPQPPWPGSCPADIQPSGVVDIDDLLMVIANWS